MEQQSRRERKKEETRRRILEAAFRLFAEQGFENTTIDQITDEADIGKGTFYNYFTTKEAALYELVEDISRQRGEKLWAGIRSCRDTRQRLAIVFKSVTSWFEEYPELVKAYVLDRANTWLKDPDNYSLNHFEQYVSEVLKMGQEAGDIRDDLDAMKMGNYLTGIFFTQICYWYAKGAGPGLYSQAMCGVDFFLIGALSTEK